MTDGFISSFGAFDFVSWHLQYTIAERKIVRAYKNQVLNLTHELTIEQDTSPYRAHAQEMKQYQSLSFWQHCQSVSIANKEFLAMFEKCAAAMILCFRYKKYNELSLQVSRIW